MLKKTRHTDVFKLTDKELETMGIELAQKLRQYGKMMDARKKAAEEAKDKADQVMARADELRDWICDGQAKRAVECSMVPDLESMSISYVVTAKGAKEFPNSQIAEGQVLHTRAMTEKERQGDLPME